MWLIGPLVFSFFSGSFLYGLLIRGFAKSHLSPENRNETRWATFMALFWLTAPIAWLYALPVERVLDPYRAAQANIALLSIVSLWRVLLMSPSPCRFAEHSFPQSFRLGIGRRGTRSDFGPVFWLSFRRLHQSSHPRQHGRNAKRTRRDVTHFSA